MLEETSRDKINRRDVKIILRNPCQGDREGTGSDWKYFAAFSAAVEVML